MTWVTGSFAISHGNLHVFVDEKPDILGIEGNSDRVLSRTPGSERHGIRGVCRQDTSAGQLPVTGEASLRDIGGEA